MRLRNTSRSSTTSVPASTRIAPAGRRTAPSRSASSAMCCRAFWSVLSSVWRDVTNAAKPPGRRAPTDRAINLS
ncbi:hypothetical protein AZ09_14340 [Acetobacter aceti 1023]|nr:hypothetical protein AZ09_14340 [Acetobacter aceti 1023]